jgi:hypothetical protein
MSLDFKIGWYSSWSNSALKKCNFAFDTAAKLSRDFLK